ncbi:MULTISPECIES: 2-amino-4-hydroxy-6-hydroxymethyldihydropteridine diphosphokinase [unclassified Colwellia]|jgi:2-amino-4-hydroxy-6-hydroxymethyldihydropteridine diphosphokinase|uniref:2-amino-4-hydroxy-6- hydroxymethyldihydropteridine diphosphokinase n=1 Tax=unclassified Colwellia TaxID=196834 RepID=UPI0015F48A7F|nr:MULTISPECIES: 2-amino-4-hydroxy-6-hydroxymethyldihydropteridine diphosphokinase [unclassified Colwellia]MBA6254080.1 2-amino-4-hydroxy-6-hydroxymethyldihydropteridine diphosphokinase [Colwellia sp. MB3u-55]MBA6396207.1 2-amino-4-hydroxy-6-hydroxymethyldihydropteridine diphosphokinase [Colwellia sp. BRX10-4]
MARLYISLGSNVDRQHYLQTGLTALEALLGELTLSSLFASKAVGFDGAEFYNMVIGATTELNIVQVAKALREIEFTNGREIDAKKYSPRTLDLDLLLFDDLVLDTPAQIPRAEITENAFVLWPLAEVAPDLKHPILKKSYQQLWQAYDKTQQQITTVDFSWSSQL